MPCSSGAGGVGSIPANSDAQNVPSFRRWRFEMKLSPAEPTRTVPGGPELNVPAGPGQAPCQAVRRVSRIRLLTSLPFAPLAREPACDPTGAILDWIMSRTLAHEHRHRPGYTYSHFIRARTAHGGSLATVARPITPSPRALTGPDFDGSASTPHPRGLSPSHGGLGSNPSGRGSTREAWLSPFPTPHSPRLATLPL
jgi:hypothetical protein